MFFYINYRFSYSTLFIINRWSNDLLQWWNIHNKGCEVVKVHLYFSKLTNFIREGFTKKKVAVLLDFVQISHGGSESATLWYQEQTSMIYLRSWIMPYWSSLRDQECPCLNCSDLVDSCSRERKLLICFVTRLESVANCFDGRPTKLLGDVHKLMEMCQLQWLARLLNRLTSN